MVYFIWCHECNSLLFGINYSLVDYILILKELFMEEFKTNYVFDIYVKCIRLYMNIRYVVEAVNVFVEKTKHFCLKSNQFN